MEKLLTRPILPPRTASMSDECWWKVLEVVKGKMGDRQAEGEEISFIVWFLHTLHTSMQMNRRLDGSHKHRKTFRSLGKAITLDRFCLARASQQAVAVRVGTKHRLMWHKGGGLLLWAAAGYGMNFPTTWMHDLLESGHQLENNVSLLFLICIYCKKDSFTLKTLFNLLQIRLMFG